MINPNTPGRGGRNAPWYIFFYNFLVIHPNFVRVGDFSKIYLGLIFWVLLFFKIRTDFLQGQHFFTNRCYFFCVSSVGIMIVSLAILVVFQSTGFRKNLYHFSNKIFPIDTVITKYEEFDLFIKILNFDDRFEIWWHYQKVT